MYTMDYLIAPTLFLKKTCNILGIGILDIVTNNSESDYINKQIRAPFPVITFSAVQNDENEFKEFTPLSNLIKKILDEKGRVELKGIGHFLKQGDGTIEFLPLQINDVFIQPVTAEKVIRKDVKHIILVGDKETTSTKMMEYYADEVSQVKNSWWIWAVVLGVAGLIVITYYLMQNSVNWFGNIEKVLN